MSCKYNFVLIFVQVNIYLELTERVRSVFPNNHWRRVWKQSKRDEIHEQFISKSGQKKTGGCSDKTEA